MIFTTFETELCFLSSYSALGILAKIKQAIIYSSTSNNAALHTGYDQNLHDHAWDGNWQLLCLLNATNSPTKLAPNRVKFRQYVFISANGETNSLP
jgi:hypothetical protein